MPSPEGEGLGVERLEGEFSGVDVRGTRSQSLVKSKPSMAAVLCQ